MRNNFLLSALIASSVSVAQSVFTYPEALPAFGGYPVETRNYGVVPGLVTTGTGVVWNFAAQGYSVVGTTTDSILDPASTPYAGDFPSANVAVRLVDQFGYYRTSSDEVLDLGMRLSAGSPSQINIDPASIVQFPSGVGDTWTDAVATASSTSQLEVSILAEGAIALADATINDAVLVERRYITPSFTSVSTTWFRRSNCLVPLGNVLSNGGVIVRVPVGLATDLLERSAGLGIIVGPNPCQGRVSVRSIDASVVDEVALMDLEGRVLQRMSPRTSFLDLELASYPAGSYLLRVNVAGREEVHRIVRVGH